MAGSVYWEKVSLAVSNQLVKKHGGDIRINQNAKQGLTFIVDLPVEQSDEN